VCPVYLNNAIRAHWGLPDPAHVIGTNEEITKAFQATYDALSVRIHKMLALPIEDMDSADITKALNEIGSQS
jgi:arsenate reductase